jgi:PIN domain nuclease of toxin-antitoxin system
MRPISKGSVLLDTIAISWLILGRSNVPMSNRVESLVMESSVYVSEVSLYEFAIQIYSQRLRLDMPVDTWIYQVVSRLSAAFIGMDGMDYRLLSQLNQPTHKSKKHSDPFDRMLVAQAINKNLTIVSCDTVFDKYGVKRLW